MYQQLSDEKIHQTGDYLDERSWYGFYQGDLLDEIDDPDSPLKGNNPPLVPEGQSSPIKKMYLNTVTSEWRTNYPTIRYKNTEDDWSLLPSDVKKSVYWTSGADSVLMPLFFADYDKSFMFYLGTFNGLGYFKTDRLYDQSEFDKKLETQRRLQEDEPEPVDPCADPESISDSV